MDVKNVKYCFHYVVKQLTCSGYFIYKYVKIKDNMFLCIKNLRFASLGHEVVGIDCVATACEEFLNENKLEYTVRNNNEFKVYEVNLFYVYEI